jgi:hypothetical protein
VERQARRVSRAFVEEEHCPSGLLLFAASGGFDHAGEMLALHGRRYISRTPET